MSITLTYWQDPLIKHTPDDYDGIKTIVLKTVKQIPQLITERPPHCTMISTERSAAVKYAKSTNPRYFKVVWEGSHKLHYCSKCGQHVKNKYGI